MALQSIGGTSTKVGISRLTTEFLYWNITSGGSFADAIAEVAFIRQGQGKPTAGDWEEAEIVPNPTDATKNSVRILVGPEGGVDLTPPTTESQTYDVWIRISSGIERIVRTAGTFVVR